MSRSFLVGTLAILLTVIWTLDGYAQRGGGPPGRGGSSGGDRGGFSGRGGSSGGFDPSDMIRRMDTNGNKMLDPSEMQGRASYLIDRLSSVMRIDKSRPIPIDQVIRGFERLRNGGGSRDSGSRDSGRTSSSSSSSNDAEPLVPGFGLDLGLDPVLGFGSMSEFFSVSVEEQDNKSASERFARYDRNKDGFLSQEELRAGRWSDDPMTYDRNKDGRISLSEMAVRYARRRVNDSGGRQQSSSSKPVFFTGGDSSSSGGRSSSSGKISKEDEERYGRFVSFMLGRYDKNKNGVLDKDEWGSLSGDASGSDKNRDGKLNKDEMIHYLANRSSSRSSGGGDRSRGSGDRSRWSGGGDRGGDRGRESDRRQYFTGASERGGSSRGNSRSTKDDERKSYRALTPTDRLVKSGLEKELPDWFFEDDKNADGQVMMHEYASRWDDATFDDFKQFDANRDGVITASECVAALDDGARKGAGSSSRSSGSSSRTSSRGSSGTRSSTESSTESSGDSSGDKYLDYARSQIAKYDTNKDRSLTPEEWKNMSRSPEAADADKDGIVTAEELAVFYRK